MYYLYEIGFAKDYSICIKSLYPDTSMEDKELLSKFLIKDIEKFGEVISVDPISEVEARSFYDFSNVDNWPVFK